MSDIIKAVLDELSKYDVEGVEEVVIVIGDLTNLGEEQLVFAFEVMSQDTVLEGSKLIVEHEKIRLKCKVCDFDGPAEVIMNEGYDHSIPVLSCPRCSGPVNVIKGMECCLRSVKIREGTDV
ncbi:MAG: hydrogenase/urease maturation nickel metallochaperone HypA [Methanomassiliicoccaceae archaeon]|nr:hydrogenase/urease maturation nickel metallochaperone HypA [Methanomassiliicoccaceae archaeon]